MFSRVTTSRKLTLMSSCGFVHQLPVKILVPEIDQDLLQAFLFFIFLFFIFYFFFVLNFLFSCLSDM
jgi:hypothetical protein